MELPWVSGCEWTGREDTEIIGVVTPHPLIIETRGLRLRLFTPRPIATGLQLHGQLLVRLIADFHNAKLREQELAQQAHLQAIYETGARVTHDIKNLLQSLYALTVAVQTGPQRHPEELQALLARQLPNLTQRLQLALDKLQAPQKSVMTSRGLAEWWAGFKRRNDTQGIVFHSELRADPQVPSEFLDSAVENLLENARFKRQTESNTAISVKTHADPVGLRIEVHDSGSAIGKEIVSQLFLGPVRSASGLGIGLFQSRTQARELGIDLELVRNDATGVTFELKRGPEAQASDGSSAGAAEDSPPMKNSPKTRRMRSSG